MDRGEGWVLGRFGGLRGGGVVYTRLDGGLCIVGGGKWT